MVPSNLQAPPLDQIEGATPDSRPAGPFALRQSRLLSLLVKAGLAAFLLTVVTVWIEAALRANLGLFASAWWADILPNTLGIMAVTCFVLRKQEGLHQGALAAIAERKQVEAALRDGEDRFRQIAETISDVFWMSDPATSRMLYVSPAYEDIWGRSCRSLIENPISFVEAIHPEDRDGFLALLQDKWAGFDTEYRIIRPDGTQRWISDRAFPIRNAEGEVYRVSGIAQDITERKNAEAEQLRLRAEIEEQRGRLDAIVATVPGLVWEKWSDPDTATLGGSFVSEYVNKMVGYTVEEWMATSDFWLTIVHPEDRERAARESSAIFAGGHGGSMQFRWMAKDGRVVWVEVQMVVTRDAAGVPIGMRGVTMDITERRRALEELQGAHQELEGRVEERTVDLARANAELQQQLAERGRVEAELREARHMLRLVMNHIPQAVFWKDRQSVYLGANERRAHDAGFASPEEFLGKTDFDLPWPGEAEGFRADDAEVMDSGISKLNVEKSYPREDGSQAWLRTNKVPLRDLQGEVIGVLATYEDITAEKEIQAALVRSKQLADDANRAKSEFLSRMSHELRTPLNAILGFGQILERKTKVESMEGEAVSHILKGGRHLLTLVNEVLDLASIEAGRLLVSPEPIPVARAVCNVLDLLAPLAAARDIHLTNEVESRDNLNVQADQQRFKQILLNLVSNAIKYNRDGGRVTVTCENNGEFLRVLVRDTGEGLAPAELDRLFVPFERLTAANLQVEGAGIGLALCKRLTEAMGGRIGVSSTPGHGSCFWVEFPRAATLNDQLKMDGPDHEPSEPAVPQRTVLYIEDNLSNFKLVQLLLDDMPGVRLLSAMQGTLGLDLARQQQPDLILLDLHLPDINGEVVLGRLRAEPTTRDIPVVVLSADAMPGQIASLRAAGIVDYLTKPINIKQFLQVVTTVLDPLAGEMT